ncbi:uncharacterized protein si:ch211-250c4.3 [Cololabis saira]|uniref:uncharacterized protein si:ch211-250c4.3 n=1 Tax=Cololabis saira TaxID=129043 RepID=UPI002AD39A0D|nr:uncharacterized protein si:ch211-250c4.3 [Cololabis saira]
MSVKVKRAGLLLRWQRSWSIPAPWSWRRGRGKGKGDRDAILGSEVILTNMKLFNNFHESFLMADDSVSTMSTTSVSDQDMLDCMKACEVNSHLDDQSSRPQTGSGSDYLSAILDSQLPRLYKFESEDSGVELASGANSPSTPTGSEHSFVVHSRESSCDSCNLSTDPACSPNELILNVQSSESKLASDPVKKTFNLTVDAQERGLIQRQECSSLAVSPSRASETSPGGEGEAHDHSEETRVLTEETRSEERREATTGPCGDMMGKEPACMRRSASSDSLEEYMDQCCRLSEVQQQNSSPPGTGLGYLEHVCQLLQKIAQLQEINLQMQRQICSLQEDGRMEKMKEDCFQQRCICGAAAFSSQELQKRLSTSDLSPHSLSDLSSIPEFSRQPPLSPRTGSRSECLTPTPLWKRSLNRRSYTEGDSCFLRDNEGLSVPQRRLSESYTWGRVKELVRKTKGKNPSRLGLSSSSLKMSCPQLYRPDKEPTEPGFKSRKSMYGWGHHSKLDLSWPQ